MKAAKILHGSALVLLGYCGLRSILVARVDGTFQLIFSLMLWSFLCLMLYRRPKTWGVGIGIFLLCVIAIQFGLWRLALTRKEEYQIDDSWLNFVLSVVPLFAAACGAISLRWLIQKKPDTPEPATTAGAA